GDFADFIEPIIKTLNLYQTQNIDLRVVAQQFKTLDLFHHEGIDPAAAAIALKQLAEQHPEAGLEIVALEGRGDDKVRVQAKVKGAVDRSALSADYFAAYREMSAMPYSDLQSLLGGIAEKDERIRSLENMVKTAIEGNKFYVETVYNLGDTVSEKSEIQINSGGGSVSGVVGGNISDVSGVVNLGTISGDVTNTIGQLPDTPDSDGPSLKDLLTQLQAVIEAEPELPPEDKAEALEQVKTLAEAGKAPEDNAIKKAARTAVKVLKGTAASLPDMTVFVQECTKLLPAIAGVLAIL
ncbi:MAG: low-complexity protein, partial [Cyanobacteria bacterium P01_D01_bin.128]